MQKLHVRKDRAIVALASRIAADAYGVFRPEIFAPKRGDKGIAMARQVAQYLAHCSGQVPLHRLAKLFKRHVTSIMHNIALIEEWRDQGEFEDLMLTLEGKFNGEQADRSEHES